MRHALRSRLRILLAGLCVFAFLLIIRLYFVQIVHGSDYALRAEHQYTNASDTLYDRGDIYFTRKDGTYISAATLSTGFLIAINPEQITDADAAYAALASVMPLERDAFMSHASKTDDPYEVIADRVSEEQGSAIAEKDIPGVIVVRERWRSYPAGADAAQTVGFVAYNNDNTLAGRYGLERYYNSTLTREGGLFGNFFAELFANLGDAALPTSDIREGNIITSIEPVVQEKLDEELRAVQGRYASAETGAIIMDPHTGAIIALDALPSFDPNDFGSADLSSLANHLVERRYEFGSILKALTMASGIDAGVITPQSTYNDTGCMDIDTKHVCNYDKVARGITTMQEVINHSLNMGAANVAGRLGHDRMRTYFTELGMGTETGIDLPSEIPGTLANLTSPGRDVNFATASFGQGIAMTPVEMIRALGALANDGSIVTPHLATAIRLESGIVRPLSWGDPVQIFTPATAATVTGMLVTAVDTALVSGKAKTPEMSVAAKTGTAQIADPSGGYYGDRYFHSFFGYFPAYNPRFIILLYTREPKGVQYASDTLTPSFVSLVHFLTNYYSIAPDRASYTTP